MVGWVVGILESNAKLNSKLRLKLKLKIELSLAKGDGDDLNLIQLGRERLREGGWIN